MKKKTYDVKIHSVSSRWIYRLTDVDAYCKVHAWLKLKRKYHLNKIIIYGETKIRP